MLSCSLLSFIAVFLCVSVLGLWRVNVCESESDICLCTGWHFCRWIDWKAVEAVIRPLESRFIITSIQICGHSFYLHRQKWWFRYMRALRWNTDPPTGGWSVFHFLKIILMLSSTLNMYDMAYNSNTCTMNIFIWNTQATFLKMWIK